MHGNLSFDPGSLVPHLMRKVALLNLHVFLVFVLISTLNFCSESICIHRQKFNTQRKLVQFSQAEGGGGER